MRQERATYRQFTFWSVLALCLLSFFSAGCSGSTQAAADEPPPVASDDTTPESPEDKLYAQLRSGHFQAGTVLDLFEQVVAEIQARAAETNDPELKDFLQMMEGSVNEAVRPLAELIGEAPTREAVGEAPAEAKKEREKLLETAEESFNQMQVVGESLQIVRGKGTGDVDLSPLGRLVSETTDSLQVLKDTLTPETES